MKATKIYYKKLFSLGNYQNEEIGIELQVEDGDKASDVLEKAKEFVNSLDPKSKDLEKYNNAMEVISHKDEYVYRRVIEAEEFIKEYNAREDKDLELPF